MRDAAMSFDTKKLGEALRRRSGSTAATIALANGLDAVADLKPRIERREAETYLHFNESIAGRPLQKQDVSDEFPGAPYGVEIEIVADTEGDIAVVVGVSLYQE